MEVCQKSLLRDWTHVLEAILFAARFMEACASKSNGRFSAVIFLESSAHLRDRESFSFREEKGRKGGEGDPRSKEELDWRWRGHSAFQYGGTGYLSREGVFLLPEKKHAFWTIFRLEGKSPCCKFYTMNLVWLGSLCFQFR